MTRVVTPPPPVAHVTRQLFRKLTTLFAQAQAHLSNLNYPRMATLQYWNSIQLNSFASHLHTTTIFKQQLICIWLLVTSLHLICIFASVAMLTLRWFLQKNPTRHQMTCSSFAYHLHTHWRNHCNHWKWHLICIPSPASFFQTPTWIIIHFSLIIIS